MQRYRRYIGTLLEELQTAIGEAELDEWHHEPEGSPLWKHYQRLVTWEYEVSERCAYHDYSKRSGPKSATYSKSPEADRHLGDHQYRRDNIYE